MRPEYKVSAVEGPAHQRLFRVYAYVDGAAIGAGTGPSKKLAENDAAKDALTHILGSTN